MEYWSNSITFCCTFLQTCMFSFDLLLFSLGSIICNRALNVSYEGLVQGSIDQGVSRFDWLTKQSRLNMSEQSKISGSSCAELTNPHHYKDHRLEKYIILEANVENIFNKSDGKAFFLAVDWWSSRNEKEKNVEWDNEDHYFPLSNKTVSGLVQVWCLDQF